MKLSPLEIRGAGSLIRDLLNTKVSVKTSYGGEWESFPNEGYETTIDGVPVKIVLKEYVGGGDGRIRAVVKYGDIHIMVTGYTSDRDDSWGQGYDSDTWDGAAQVVEYKEVTIMDWTPVS